MLPRLKYPLVNIALFTTFFMMACGNKLDKTLDHLEAILSKYETKAQHKKLTQQDLQEMNKDFDAIDQEFTTNIGKLQTELTESERERTVRLTARREKLEAEGYRLTIPY
jgi:hypothetical protein